MILHSLQSLTQNKKESCFKILLRQGPPPLSHVTNRNYFHPYFCPLPGYVVYGRRLTHEKVISMNETTIEKTFLRELIYLMEHLFG